jgi:hypothetical protein
MDSQKNDKKIGFDGFNAMVSDIDTEIEKFEKSVLPIPAKKLDDESLPIPVSRTQNIQPVSSKPSSVIYSTLTVWSSRVIGSAWVWGIVFMVSIIWLANDNKEEAISKASTAQRNQYTLPAPSITSPQTQVPSTAQRQTEYGAEERPPVGSGMKFDSAQIRYCLSESIRIDGMKRVVNNYSESSVSAFNYYVSDYNARCSSFRYRSGLLETVRSEVNSRRAKLESEGVNRVLTNP